MSRVLRCGVIGLGMGRGHAQAYAACPQAELVAVCDLDEGRCARARDEHGVESHTDVAEFLARGDLDVVSIATPNALHKPFTLAALEAGCHVLCEKPLAMNAAEAREMVASAAAAERRLMVNFSYRFREQTWALKRRVEAGDLGAVYYGRTWWHRRRGLPGFGGWFGRKELSGGGPLIDLGVHRIDLALWLMGHPRPVWVLGATYDPIASRLAREQGKAFDVEDLAAATIRFENGAMLHAEASWAGHIGENEQMETRLWGTEGGLVQRNVGEGYEMEGVLFLERNGAQYDMRMHPPMPAAPSAQAHLVQSILDDEPHTADGNEGLMVMELLDAIYESAARGAPVRIGEAAAVGA